MNLSSNGVTNFRHFNYENVDVLLNMSGSHAAATAAAIDEGHGRRFKKIT